MRVGRFVSGLVVVAGLLGGCASAPSHEDMQATFDAGLKDYDAGDYKAAYDKWHKIDGYDLAALRNVALLLRRGQGVPKDPKAALAKMGQAADAGLPTAQADLGDMLLKGEAGPPDPAAAAPWLARAAAAGHPIAAYQLAQLYETGTGVPKDIEAARKLYERAAKAGVNEAAARLAALPPASASVDPPAKPEASTH
jgi:TPR repeat protein